MDHREPTRPPFVGVAISGGGSRSANFAAAVMEELDYYGFLDHVNAISAVSGGTLPAAYYVLKRKKPDWNWGNLRSRVGANIYSRLLLKHINPWKLLNYAFTEYNRSDMMAEVFDDLLLDNATFGDIDPSMPQLLINATEINGASFVFSTEMSYNLRSSFADYPISRALAASTSVPGIFQGIAIRTYQTEDNFSYLHLVDGGITENLGLENLLQHYMDEENTAAHPLRKVPPRACFIFLIDASASGSEAQRVASYQRRDLRNWSDFIVDRNLMNAFDVMFGRAHSQFISRLRGRLDDDAVFESPIQLNYGRVNCTIWQFHPRFLIYHGLRFDNPDNYPIAAQLSAILSQIETHWKLSSPTSCSSAALQAALYDGARMLVSADRGALNTAITWFASHDLRMKQDVPRSSPYEFFSKHVSAVTSENNVYNGSGVYGQVFCERGD
ncbi:MAG TPA: patatin-like phospholipase family protein [Nitrospira sp.]|nr:patatin-like phospholipase family protein [Nitrospira sp.]